MKRLGPVQRKSGDLIQQSGIMTKGNFNTFSSNTTLHGRLAAYSALAAAGACAVAAPQAQAAVVTSGPLNITVPNTLDGIYLNLVTGATGTTGSSVTGFDFNPYATGGAFATYFSGTATAGNYIVFTPGSTVSAANTFGTGSTATTELFYRAGVADGFLGIHFLNEATGVLNYGYVELKTTGATGFPATILSYGYENTGAALTIPGAVPEPTTLAALGLGALALGASGVRRWRRAKQTA